MRHPDLRRRLAVAALALACAAGAAAVASPAFAATGSELDQSTQASYDAQRTTGDANTAGVACSAHMFSDHAIGFCVNPDPNVSYQVVLFCRTSAGTGFWYTSPIVPTTQSTAVGCSSFFEQAIAFDINYWGTPAPPPPPPPSDPPPPPSGGSGGCDPDRPLICEEEP